MIRRAPSCVERLHHHEPHDDRQPHTADEGQHVGPRRVDQRVNLGVAEGRPLRLSHLAIRTGQRKRAAELHVVRGRDRPHRDEDRDERPERDPEPRATPEAAAEAGRYAAGEEEHEADVHDPDRALAHLEQGRHPIAVPLSVELQGGPHRDAMREDEQEGAEDVGEHEPGMHRSSLATAVKRLANGTDGMLPGHRY